MISCRETAVGRGMAVKGNSAEGNALTDCVCLVVMRIVSRLSSFIDGALSNQCAARSCSIVRFVFILHK
jgi:hypothetical protein